MQIELLYAFSIGLSIAVLIGTLYGKLSIPMAMIIIFVIGIGITWVLSPYISLILTPLWNSVWFGYTWGWLEILALAHLITTFWVSGVMLYNLYRSEGVTGWA